MGKFTWIIVRQNIAGWCQQTFCCQKVVDKAQQCFVFTPQANYPLIIWIFAEVEGDGIESSLPFKMFSTLMQKQRMGHNHLRNWNIPYLQEKWWIINLYSVQSIYSLNAIPFWRQPIAIKSTLHMWLKTSKYKKIAQQAFGDSPKLSSNGLASQRLIPHSGFIASYMKNFY